MLVIASSLGFAVSLAARSRVARIGLVMALSLGRAVLLVPAMAAAYLVAALLTRLI
jgi:hypothetical protein